jgi:ankyrin repeat protein
MRLLLDHGADPNVRDKWNETLLHKALIKGNVAMLRLLLRHGADYTLKRDYSQQTAFDLAKVMQNEAADWLLNHIAAGLRVE